MPADARATYEAVGAALAQIHGARSSKMFGMPCLKVGGKAFAGLYDDALVVKLDADARPHALALAGAHLFDPMGGRPMKEWVVVPPAHAAQWEALAGQALAYVAATHL